MCACSHHNASAQSCPTTLTLTYSLPFPRLIVLPPMYQYAMPPRSSRAAPHRRLSDPTTTLDFALCLSRHTHRCASFRNRNPLFARTIPHCPTPPFLRMHCRWRILQPPTPLPHLSSPAVNVIDTFPRAEIFAHFLRTPHSAQAE